MSGARPLVLLAPGAGAPSSSDWMRAWAERLSQFGDVRPFDYPYQQQKRKRPDPQPKLIAAHRDALAAAHAGHSKTFLVGKSMGSRIGCHVALEEPVDALVCLGYPLRGASGALRDQVLRALRTPILFVQGTRDALCPLDELARVRNELTAPNELFVVDGGDHSLVLSAGARKAQHITQDESDARVLQAIGTFLRTHAA